MLWPFFFSMERSDFFLLPLTISGKVLENTDFETYSSTYRSGNFMRIFVCLFFISHTVHLTGWKCTEYVL